MAHWKAHGRLSIHLDFSLSITVPKPRGEMCTARLFVQEGRPLRTQILPGKGHPPSTVLGVRKLETLDYPTAKTASLCVPSFWHNTTVWRTERETDKRTNRQICHSIYNACKASFAARCKTNGYRRYYNNSN